MANPVKPQQRTDKPISEVHEAFVENQAGLKRFIARFLGNRQDIEDVSQEAFLRAFSAERDRKIDRPKSYLYRIAKHVALSKLTHKSRKITDYIEEIDSSEVLNKATSAEDELVARQSLGIHCEAVAGLPRQCRRVYLMRKTYGMSHREIADRLGISTSTVEKHLIKGVKQCDEYIRDKMDGDYHPIRRKAPTKVVAGEKQS